MTLKRREFLRSTVVGAGTVTLSVPFIQGEEKKKNRRKIHSADPTALVPLTDKITCSRIGLGTGMHGYNRQSNMTRLGSEKAIDIIRYAYERGMRLFDCADAYGTHGLIRQALADKPRDSYTLITKVWVNVKGGVPEKERPASEIVVKRFLKELNTDYIDLVQLHCMRNGSWDTEFARYFDELEDLKQKGIIRGHGITCHALTSVQKAINIPWVDALHVRLNSEGAHMDGSWEDNAAAVDACHDKGKGIIVMKVLGQGSFKDSEVRRRSIDKILRYESADVMVVGFSNRAEIDEFLTNAAASLKTIAAES